MCGITGFWDLKQRNNKEHIETIIKNMTNVIQSRGPDDKGLWESECKKVCFGHNRLSIIDLSKNGKQPFISMDENFIITFNGEIYNYKEIRKELIAKNINFKSHSDTEVIIESYKYWGLEFLKKLRGMFAFALWDLKKKKLI